MNIFERIFNIITGLLMFGCGIFAITNPIWGYYFAVIILLFSLAGKGIGKLFYFFTMARHMVDGWSIFYSGVIYLDLGLFSLCLYSVPQEYTMLYLVVAFAALGVIGILHAFEERKLKAAWKKDFFAGLFKVAIALICILFIGSKTIFTYVFCVGLFMLAIDRIVKGLRKYELIYVES